MAIFVMELIFVCLRKVFNITFLISQYFFNGIFEKMLILYEKIKAMTRFEMPSLKLILSQLIHALHFKIFLADS